MTYHSGAYVAYNVFNKTHFATAEQTITLLPLK